MQYLPHQFGTRTSDYGGPHNRRHANYIAPTSQNSRYISPTPKYPRRRSRSKSPIRVTPYQHNAPSQHKSGQKQNSATISTTRTQSFRPGASSSSHSACAVCLGRHQHLVAKCNSETLWDDQRAWCRRNQNNRLVNPSGDIVCSDWQRPSSCPSKDHDSRHQCSGCGKQDHGAQQCPRAQKE